MKSTTILMKVDPKLKAEAQKLAEKCGVSLNAVLSRSLQTFVRDRSITFADDATAYLPTPKTAHNLRKQLKDIRNGKNIGPTFEKADQAIVHLKKLCK